VLFLAGDDSRAIPTSLTLRDESVVLRYGLRLGRPVGDFANQLGPPFKKSSHRWQYVSVGSEVNLEVSDGVVRALRWLPAQD
jgi:hypothetical protein